MKKIVLGIALLLYMILPVFADSGACDGKLMLGYFFQNGEEPAIVTRDGSILFNPNHDMEVFVEVCSKISEVKIGNEDDLIDLDYDSETALWFGIIPKHLIEEEKNSLNILIEGEESNFVEILNVKMFEDDVDGVFREYEIYNFSGYKWEKIEYSEDEVFYPIFSLPSGRYYARLRDESTWFYSSIIDLDETTIVSFSYGERNLPVFFSWFARYFSPLEQEFFNSSYYLEDPLDEQKLQDFFGIEAYVDSEKNTLFMYMNRWNPFYEEFLKMFESDFDHYDIILFTDDNNFLTLEENLLDFNRNIELYEIDGLLLESLVVQQPKVYFYESGTEGIVGFFRVQDLNILK